VVIDIYFDHLLCANWSRFSDCDLDKLLGYFYDEVHQYPDNISDRFEQVRNGLLSYRWLSDYRQAESCERSFLHIEKRLSKRVIFAHQATEFIQQNENELQTRFLSFYPELIAFSHAKVKALKVQISV